MSFEGLGSIGQIHLSVADVDRAIGFYRDVLGVPLLFRVPDQPMAFFDCGAVRLYLGVPESEAYRSRGMVYFSVDDVDEAYRALSARGVRFLGGPHVVHRTADSELRMAFFADPDGNNLAIMADVPLAQSDG